MKELPSPGARHHIHTRTVTSQGFLREDGHWDVDGELVDLKTYIYADRERGPLPVGSPMHHMRARVTVDNNLRVIDAHAAMPALPFAYCAGALAGVEKLRGELMGPGWRHAVSAAMGASRGCTHMRELFYLLATTAFQTISAYREQHMPELGTPKDLDTGKPFFLDGCHSWSQASPVVAQYFPEFHRKL